MREITEVWCRRPDLTNYSYQMLTYIFTFYLPSHLPLTNPSLSFLQIFTTAFFKFTAITTDTWVVASNLWSVACDRRFWRTTACVGAFRFFVHIHSKLSHWGGEQSYPRGIPSSRFISVVTSSIHRRRFHKNCG